MGKVREEHLGDIEDSQRRIYEALRRMEVPYSLFVEETEVSTAGSFHPGATDMASVLNRLFSDPKDVDLLRRALVRRIIQRHFRVLATGDSGDTCPQILAEDELVAARIIAYREGVYDPVAN